MNTPDSNAEDPHQTIKPLSQSSSAGGWKHEPMTSEQAKRIIEVLERIRKMCVVMLSLIIFIWLKTLFLR